MGVAGVSDHSMSQHIRIFRIDLDGVVFTGIHSRVRIPFNLVKCMSRKKKTYLHSVTFVDFSNLAPVQSDVFLFRIFGSLYYFGRLKAIDWRLKHENLSFPPPGIGVSKVHICYLLTYL